MFNVTLTGLWARKRRLIGTSLAVVLGVAFLAATLVLGDTMRAGFDQAFTDANAGTRRRRAQRRRDRLRRQHASAAPSTPSTVDEVAAVPGVRAAVPTVDGVATLLGADGERIGGDGPPTTGTNWIDDPDLNPYRLAEGRAPAAPGEVVIDRGSAEHGDLAVGDRTTVLDADARRGHRRRHRHVRRRRQPRPDDLHGVHAAAGDASCSPSGPTRSRRSSWPPRTGSARRRCATRSPSCCRRASRR